MRWLGFSLVAFLLVPFFVAHRGSGIHFVTVVAFRRRRVVRDFFFSCGVAYDGVGGFRPLVRGVDDVCRCNEGWLSALFGYFRFDLRGLFVRVAVATWAYGLFAFVCWQNWYYCFVFVRLGVTTTLQACFNV